MYTEKELIRGCKKEQVRYQEGLYKHFYGFAMSVCIRYAPCREDALEILNDSFMKVFSSIRYFDEERSFKAWFRRILVNTSLDHYRANRRYRLHIELNDEKVEIDSNEEHNIKLQADEILALMDQIPPIQRLVLNLHKIEGYPHDEIAEMLDIAPGTSRSHMSRAIKKLAALFLAGQNKSRHEAI